MTAAFEPADGKQARWRYAYDLVLGKEPGDEVTLMELAEALGLEFDISDTVQRQLLWSVMGEAKHHLETDKQQTVKSVPKYGWIVMRPDQNLDEADARRHKAGRAVSRTARLLGATEVSALSPHQRQRHDFLTSAVVRTAALFDRKPRSLADLESKSQQRKLPGTSAPQT